MGFSSSVAVTSFHSPGASQNHCVSGVPLPPGPVYHHCVGTQGAEGTKGNDLYSGYNAVTHDFCSGNGGDNVSPQSRALAISSNLRAEQRHGAYDHTQGCQSGQLGESLSRMARYEGDRWDDSATSSATSSLSSSPTSSMVSSLSSASSFSSLGHVGEVTHPSPSATETGTGVSGPGNSGKRKFVRFLPHMVSEVAYTHHKLDYARGEPRGPLTLIAAIAIRDELVEFKRNEMIVHPDSAHLTHFYETM